MTPSSSVHGALGGHAGGHIAGGQLEEFWWLGGARNGQDAGLPCTCAMVFGCHHTKIDHPLSTLTCS